MKISEFDAILTALGWDDFNFSQRSGETTAKVRYWRRIGCVPQDVADWLAKFSREKTDLTAIEKTAPRIKSSLIPVQIVYDNRRVHFRAEPELVEAIDRVCAHDGITRADLVMRAEAAQSHGTLTSAIRAHVLRWLLNRVGERK